MDGVYLKVNGTRQVRAALRKAAELGPHAMASALVVEAESIITASKEELVSGRGFEGGAFDTGTLAATGHVESPTMTPVDVTVAMGFGGPAAPYALYIHEGTGPAVGRPPFRPPVSAFKDWARRVLGNEALAFVVARSVGLKGLRPRKYLERPFRAAAEGMPGRLATRIQAYMASHLGPGRA